MKREERVRLNELEARVCAVDDLVGEKLGDPAEGADSSFGLRWDHDQKWSNIGKRNERPLERMPTKVVPE